MRPGSRFDQLRGDAHPCPGFADRAFEDIAHAQVAPDLLHIDALALVGEARIARDDEEPPDARECRDDLLDHAVGEIFLLGIAAHVGKRQHRDRRLVGKSESRRATLTRLAPLAPLALGTLSRIAGEGGPWRSSGMVGEGVADAVRPDWARDVFERLFADVFE